MHWATAVAEGSLILAAFAVPWGTAICHELDERGR